MMNFSPKKDEREASLSNIAFIDDSKRVLFCFFSAVFFSVFLMVFVGKNAALDFTVGFLLEQCLSIDNLFVFILLFDYFGIEKQYQDRVLRFGLYGAIILRAVFISLGYVIIQYFNKILLIFGLILVYSSIKVVFLSRDSEAKYETNFVINFTKRFFKVVDRIDGENFFIRDPDTNVLYATPLFLCLVCVEFSDIMFAVDSVPAIYGITKDPLIVFSSNIFAIASLRSLYGVLTVLVSQIEFIEKVVGLILGIIGIKMILETFEINIISPITSLCLFTIIIFCSLVLSYFYSRNRLSKFENFV